MKKSMFIFLLLAICSFSSAAYADKIPGFLEFDSSISRWGGVSPNNKFGSVDINFVYGATHKYFQPYFHGGFTSYFHLIGTEDYPALNTYSFGWGLRICKLFYIEYAHKRTNYLNYRTFITNDSELMFMGAPGASFDVFRVGIKFEID